MATPGLLGKQAGFNLLQTRHVDDADTHLDRLAVVAGVPVAVLEAIAYGSTQHALAFFCGIPISASLLKGSTVFRRVCPECLIESPYYRAAWDLAFSSACPVHNRLLLDTCPDCGKPLRWRGVDLTRCGCSRGLLTRIRPTVVQSETLDGLRLACGLLGDNRFQADVDQAQDLIPFNDLPPVAIVEFIFRLGMDLTAGPRRKLFSLENPGHLDDLPHTALHRGLNAARLWPLTFTAACAAIDEKAWSLSASRVRSNWFTAISKWLSSLPTVSGLELMRGLGEAEVSLKVRRNKKRTNH